MTNADEQVIREQRATIVALESKLNQHQNANAGLRNELKALKEQHAIVWKRLHAAEGHLKQAANVAAAAMARSVQLRTARNAPYAREVARLRRRIGMMAPLLIAVRDLRQLRDRQAPPAEGGAAIDRLIEAFEVAIAGIANEPAQRPDLTTGLINFIEAARRVLFEPTITEQAPNQELEHARADAARFKHDHERACQTIASMHAAAVGEVRGPTRGVVEDVVDLRAAYLRRGALLRSVQPGTVGHVDFVCEKSPGPSNECVFVELEDETGRSIKLGEWVKRPDGFHALRIPRASIAFGPASADPDHG